MIDQSLMKLERDVEIEWDKSIGIQCNAMQCNQSINQSIDQSIDQSINQSIDQSINQSMQSINQSINAINQCNQSNE